MSVTICSHNPRLDFLSKVLNALKCQTMPKESWEILLIDNASTEPLAGRWDLSWHPNAQCLREEKLGKPNAILLSIAKSRGEIIVIVDDDNVLAPDYLVTAWEIGKRWPMLGVWGGQKHPEFETPPPPWLRPYWKMLAILEFDKDGWSNQGETRAWPCGAGMCVRRSLAERYATVFRVNPLRERLGRKGKSLIAAEDTDLVCAALDAGYGSGLFVSLHLNHLIDKKRLQEDYLIKLYESMASGDILVAALYNKPSHRPKFLRTAFNIARALLCSRIERRMRLARLRGERIGRRMVEESGLLT